ncbi:MAG: hypothetical protein M4579_006386 [Chaenotheca gracillima]|nr:MAG: hypothetical protein M4579_006386 [Chaenotheca gracillima]
MATRGGVNTGRGDRVRHEHIALRDRPSAVGPDGSTKTLDDSTVLGGLASADDDKVGTTAISAKRSRLGQVAGSMSEAPLVNRSSVRGNSGYGVLSNDGPNDTSAALDQDEDEERQSQTESVSDDVSSSARGTFIHELSSAEIQESIHTDGHLDEAPADNSPVSLQRSKKHQLISLTARKFKTDFRPSSRYPQVIAEQTKFYHQDPGVMYQILLTLSTQILGYTFAGLTRRYLVRPSAMIWPATLLSAAMFTTLHKEENKIANGWRISRWRFFLIVWLGGFAFYFLPGLLVPAMSYFNVITWFAPKNVVIANLVSASLNLSYEIANLLQFGVSSGLGLFPMTFDWSQIAYIGSPLLTPFWAAMNVVGGLVIVMWVIAPVMYYSNIWSSAYMPILSSAVFDNEGKPYDVSKILTSDFLFDEEAYSKYSRVFLPITYVLSYAVQFASLTALVTHTACWHGRDILRQSKKSLRTSDRDSAAGYEPLDQFENDDHTSPSRSPKRRRSSTLTNMTSIDSDAVKTEDLLSKEDVHARLMRRYKDAPLWWYLVTFVITTLIGIFVVEYYPVYLPWYGLLLALAIGGSLFIPIGIVMAITNQQSSLYLICQLVCGVCFPGRPVANMVFVTYGYISSMQGLKFSSDLKLGHYMKIPPRTLFLVQMAATVVSSFTQIGVLNWMFRNIRGICTPEAINGFTCPIARVHFNGSILWGVVGPRKFFGHDALYRPMIWAFLVGAVAPVLLWLAARKKKRGLLRKINLPVVLGSISWIPPAVR